MLPKKGHLCQFRCARASRAPLQGWKVRQGPLGHFTLLNQQLKAVGTSHAPGDPNPTCPVAIESCGEETDMARVAVRGCLWAPCWPEHFRQTAIPGMSPVLPGFLGGPWDSTSPAFSTLQMQTLALFQVFLGLIQSMLSKVTVTT